MPTKAIFYLQWRLKNHSVYRRLHGRLNDDNVSRSCALNHPSAAVRDSWCEVLGVPICCVWSKPVGLICTRTRFQKSCGLSSCIFTNLRCADMFFFNMLTEACSLSTQQSGLWMRWDVHSWKGCAAHPFSDKTPENSVCSPEFMTTHQISGITHELP